MNWKTLVFLLLLVGGLVYLVQKQGEAEKQIQEPYRGHLLGDMRPNDVVEIRWDHVERDENIALEKREGVWYITDPKDYPAAPDRIKLVMDGLFANAIEIPEEELGHIKPRFDPPRAVVTVIEQKEGGARRQVQVSLGGLDPDEMQLEVKKGDRYLRILRNLDTALLGSVNDLREKKVFRITPGRIVEIHRSGFAEAPEGMRDLSFSARREGPYWQQYQPQRVRLDPTSMDLMTRVLASVRVQKFLSDNPEPDLEAYGLNLPEITLRLVDASGGEVELLVSNRQDYVAKLSDSHHIFELPDKVVGHLIDDWSYLRDHRLLHAFRRDIGHADLVSASGTVRLTQGSGQNAEWRVSHQAPGGTEFQGDWPGDQKRIQEFLGELEKSGIDKWLPPGEETVQEHFPAGELIRRLTIAFRYDLEGETSSARFGKPLKTEEGTPMAPYLRDEDQVAGLVPEDLLDWFEGGPQVWRSPLMWEIREGRLKGLVVSRQDPEGQAETREYLRKLQGTWRYVDANTSPKEMLAALDHLVFLRAESYLVEGENVPLLDPLQVTLEHTDGQTSTVTVGKAPDGQVRLQTGESQAVAAHQPLHGLLQDLFE